jgi:rhodanese-related sulfurtransferase
MPSRFVQLVNLLRPNIAEIQAVDLAAQLQSGFNGILIDVRETAEYNQGHLPNAINLSKGLLECQIEQYVFDTNTPIVLYCSGGFRSILAAHNLQQMGYSQVQSLAQGSSHWQQLGLAWFKAP